MAKHNETGKLGEEIATTFLKKQGFEVLERNYWRKWGEIDIVAREKSSGIVHFVEVKSTARSPVARENSSECSTWNDWLPEEMVHNAKIKRLRRVIQTYILQNDVGEWVFDVLVVYIDKASRTAKCKFIKDIVL